VANNYNSQPIYLTADIASSTSWRTLQTLNTGNMPANAQQNSGTVKAYWGFRAVKVLVSGGTAGDVITFVDPQSSTVFLTVVCQGANTNVEVDLNGANACWRDFYTTGISTAAAVVQIWYRV
jgi:hypothetical protein